VLDAVARQERKRTSFLFGLAEAEIRLAEHFGTVEVTPRVYDAATDIVQVRRADPVAHAFLAVIDLECPALEVRVDNAIQTKTLTSEFARENECTVAVNGEAGASSRPESGLGPWVGNLVCRGRAVLLEDSDQRPFLSFDRANRASYSPAAVVDRKLTPEKFNVIWGRMDSLVAGKVVTAEYRNRQPRTAMAVDRDGTRLYLLVVDGRQPDYSLGFTRAEVGEFLEAFGARDGMLCDEGGSSCFYVRDLGGIADIPSDGRGRERPTYTHFGVTLRKRGRPHP
jgi:hypothetical protein